MSDQELKDTSHEINNYLSTIASISYLLERHLDQEPIDKIKIKSLIKKINQAAFSISERLRDNEE